MERNDSAKSPFSWCIMYSIGGREKKGCLGRTWKHLDSLQSDACHASSLFPNPAIQHTGRHSTPQLGHLRRNTTSLQAIKHQGTLYIDPAEVAVGVEKKWGGDADTLKSVGAVPCGKTNCNFLRGESRANKFSIARYGRSVGRSVGRWVGNDKHKCKLLWLPQRRRKKEKGSKEHNFSFAAFCGKG